MSEFHIKNRIKEREEIEENLKQVKYKLVVMSGKGGVGKSTVTTALATAFFYLKKGVGILDADIHGPSVPKILGIQDMRGKIQGDENAIYPIIVKENLKIMSIDLLVDSSDTPIVWRGPLKMKIINDFLSKVKWGSLDFMIVDLPPGTGDEPLSIAQMLPSIDGIIIVTTPQDVALHSVRKSIKFAKNLNMPILGLIENMSSFICPNCNHEVHIFGNNLARKTTDDFGIRYLGDIPIDPLISEKGDRGMMLDYSDKSITSQRFMNIAKYILEILPAK